MGLSNQSVKFESNYVDLRMLLHSLLEKKWLILGISIFTFILAMVYVLLKPTKYQATVLLQVYHKHDSSLGAITDTNQPSSSDKLTDEPISVQIALIRSKFILGPVIKSLGLDILVKPYQKSSLNFFSHSNNGIQISELEVPVKYLNKRLYLKVDKTNHYRLYAPNQKLLLEGNVGQLVTSKNLFSIKVDNINAANSSEFLVIKRPESEIINQVHSHLLITDLSGSVDNQTNKVGILQLSLIGDNPDKTMQMINKIALITQLKDTERKSLEAKKTLEFLYQQLPIIEDSLKTAEAKLNEYRSTSGKIDIKLQTQYLLTHLSDIDKQLESIRLKKMDLSQKFTIYHPFIITLNQKHKELNKQRDEILDQIKKLPAADQVAASLTRDVNVKNNLYMILLNKIHEQQVITAGIVSDVRILSLATFPDMPLPIKLTIIGFASLSIGLILGCLGVLVWQMFRRRISDPHWVERNFNLKNLIILPYSKRQASNSSRLKSGNNKNLPLLAHESPNDLVIESMRFLHTFLNHNIQKTHNNILTMMSICKNVGKTFVTANFASVLAAAGGKILLIDADLREGHIHQYFGFRSIPGLTDLLKGKVSMQDALIQNQDFDNLFFLPSGTLAENPTKLLMSNHFKLLLLELAKSYEYVIINTSPILSVSDGAVIGKIAGTNLLVLGANMHEPWEISIAIKNIRHAGVTLHGSIFNNLKPVKFYQYFNIDHVYDELIIDN